MKPLIPPNPDKLNEVKMEVCMAIRRVALQEGVESTCSGTLLWREP